MEIDSLIKAKKPHVQSLKNKAPKRKGKPLSKRLLSPRQDVVRLKSKRTPPSFASFESISPRRHSNGVVSLDTVAQLHRHRTDNRNDKNTQAINVKEIEEEYRNLQAKQTAYNEKCLARKDPHRLRIPVSPRVLTFNKPLSVAQARKLHGNSNGRILKSTQNYKNIIKRTSVNMQKRVKNVYSTVTSKEIDALGSKTKASEILENYVKKSNSTETKQSCGIREKDFIFFC